MVTLHLQTFYIHQNDSPYRPEYLPPFQTPLNVFSALFEWLTRPNSLIIIDHH
jgi:hypothetical protein